MFFEVIKLQTTVSYVTPSIGRHICFSREGLSPEKMAQFGININCTGLNQPAKFFMYIIRNSIRPFKVSISENDFKNKPWSS